MGPASRRRMKVVVNGKPYTVEVEDLATSPVRVTVDGRPYEVDIETIESEVAQGEPVAAPAQPAAVESVAPAGRPAQPPAAPGSASAREITAPMPGSILDIFVEVGDSVSAGQELCSLEAMKMKNAIRTSRDGVIATIKVAVGQSVAHGDLLFTIE